MRGGADTGGQRSDGVEFAVFAGTSGREVLEAAEELSLAWEVIDSCQQWGG